MGSLARLLASSILLAVSVAGRPPALAASDCASLFLDVRPPVIFQSTEVLDFGLKADFVGIAKKSDFQKEGEKRDAKKFYSPGELTVGRTKFQVEVRGNGESSADKEEASFRKLKVRLHPTVITAAVFQNLNDFYINTHMQTSPKSKWSPLERLVDGNSPFREALVYDIANALGLETGGYRRAWISYEDSISNQKFKRQALLIESHDAVAKRLGLKPLSVGEFLNKSVHTQAEKIDAVKVHLFQALIGNVDFGYDIKRKAAPTFKFQPLKNVAVFTDSKGQLKPVVYDFDIATIVTGYDNLKPWQANPEFGLNDLSYSFTYRQLINLRTEFDRNELEQGIDYFLKRLPRLKALIQRSVVDDEGKAVALHHIDNFAKAAVDIFDSNLKFIADSKVRFFELPNGRKSKLNVNYITQTASYLRKGTPFKILDEVGDYLKIVIIDLKFDLKAESGPVGYIKKDSPIGTDVPQGSLPFPDTRDLYFAE